MNALLWVVVELWVNFRVKSEGKKGKGKEEGRRGNGDRSFPRGKRPRSGADHEETVSKNSHTCENAVTPPLPLLPHSTLLDYGLLPKTYYEKCTGGHLYYSTLSGTNRQILIRAPPSLFIGESHGALVVRV